MLRYICICAVLLVFTAAVPAVASTMEKRCGWWDNPSPGNVSLLDWAGEWVLSVQGNYSADFIATPEFDADDETQYVRTGNATYGYGCACLTGQVDKKEKRFESVTAAEVLPLAKCRVDQKVKKHKEE